MAELKEYSLSLRISERSMFAAVFASQVAGQSQTKFYEWALLARAATEGLVNGKSWEHFWDESEAVRWLKVYQEPKFPLDSERPKSPHMTLLAREVVLAHREYFYDGKEPNRARAEVLWTDLQHWMDLWQQSRATNPHAVAEAMAAKLKKAGLKVPK